MKLLTRRLKSFYHLSEEGISRLVSGELPTLHRLYALKHIEQCWQCRCKRDSYERVAMRVTAHYDQMITHIPQDPQRRMHLLAILRERAENVSSEEQNSRHGTSFRKRVGTFMNPLIASVASVAILATALGLIAWIWRRPLVAVDAPRFLSRVATSDLASEQRGQGVVYQRVRIVTSNARIEHEIYRDLRGVRRRRPELMRADAKLVAETLSAVGIDWEAPLSAASFQAWHSRQTSVRDRIKVADGTLTLITEDTDSLISRESLTVRASDFHPIARKVETRSGETIEIAELNYAILEWTAVNQSLFEPLPQPTNLAPAIEVAALPTEMELDRAELSARFELNRLRADAGEQIAVTRTDRDIEVRGVVDTSERKQQIVGALDMLPHVHTDVLSISQLHAKLTLQPPNQSVTVQSIEVLSSSPLEQYLNLRRNPSLDMVEASHSLLDAALRIRQNVKQVEALRMRLSHMSDAIGKDEIASELAHSYTDRILAALKDEDGTLRRLGFLPSAGTASETPPVDLRTESDDNEARCRELIAGSDGDSRPASAIAADMFRSLNRLQVSVEVLRSSN
jgi:hypothetical protein